MLPGVLPRDSQIVLPAVLRQPAVRRRVTVLRDGGCTPSRGSARITPSEHEVEFILDDSQIFSSCVFDGLKVRFGHTRRCRREDRPLVHRENRLHVLARRAAAVIPYAVQVKEFPEPGLLLEL